MRSKRTSSTQHAHPVGLLSIVQSVTLDTNSGAAHGADAPREIIESQHASLVPVKYSSHRERGGAGPCASVAGSVLRARLMSVETSIVWCWVWIVWEGGEGLYGVEIKGRRDVR